MQRIIVNPNGADSNAFHYSNVPQHPDRTICVGKIEPRKQQSKLQHNKSIWFAGNRCGTDFDYQSGNYLGEWNKPTLYEHLTDYANLILLSDGEADPLVIKEAFVAGLGVVINRWSIANLDLSKEFITVIPDDKLNDQLYIEKAIESNRIYSVANREQIREYSKNFWWENLVPAYISRVKSLVFNNLSNCKSTIVSAYFQIPSKLPHEKYLPFVENFLKNVGQHCIFFTSASLLGKLYLFANSNVEFHVFDLQTSFETSKEFWNEQITRDPEKYHTAQLGHLWNLKKTFVLLACELTKERYPNHVSHNYIWCDAGCVRKKVLEKALCDFGKRFQLQDNLLHIQQVVSLSPIVEEKITNQNYYKYPTVKISCAIMFGKECAWKQFDKNYLEMLKKYNENKIPAIMDQYVALSCIDTYPENFSIHAPQSGDMKDLGWFRFLLDI